MPRRRPVKEPIEGVPRRIGGGRGPGGRPRAKRIEPITIISPPTRPEVRKRPMGPGAGARAARVREEARRRRGPGRR